MNKNYLVYPTKNLKITQSYKGTYSHSGNYNGKPCDYPIDEAGADSSREYFYCPCDGMKIKHIYGVGGRGTNTIWLESTSKVTMPCGTDYVTIMVIHPMDDDLSKLKVGQVFKRGEKMFREGTDGNASGNHFHISVGKGKYRKGWVENSKGNWVIDTTKGSIKPEEAFYIDTKFTNVLKTANLNFKNLPKLLMGDLDNDGKVTAIDARIALRIAAKMQTPTEYQLKVGDINKDGKITAADARAILLMSAGLK